MNTRLPLAFGTNKRWILTMLAGCLILLIGQTWLNRANAKSNAAHLTMPAFASCATPQFGATANFPAGQSPRIVALSDFNLDGKQDVAVTYGAGFDVTVMLGNGDGTLQAGVNYTVGENPYGVAVGDFNQDGKPDLVAAVKNNVAILLGNGNGTFQPAVTYLVFQFSANNFVAVSDYNRDGKQDLAVTSYANDMVSILLGNGDGSFQAATSYATGTTPSSVVAGDFNRDGNQDLAVTNEGTDNNLSIMLGNGNGTFQSRVNYSLGTAQIPYPAATGDFNADGKLDIVTANSTTDNLSVLLGNGDGTFATAVNYPVAERPGSVAVGDFNSDGILDLAAGNRGVFAGDYNVAVLLGNGDGTFQPRVSFGGMSAVPVFTAVGDLNGDRKPDLITADDPNAPGYVSTLLNTCACTPPDVTISGTVQAVCTSETGNTIFVPSAGAGATYTWTNYGYNGTITSATNTPSLTFTAGASGIMTLGVTVTNAGGCTASNLIYIPINPLPTPGNYPAAVTINIGTGTTVTPSTPPGPSSTLVSVTVAAPGFTGGLSVNPTTGVVTITNAAPAGTYTVSVTAVASCYISTNTVFSLTVNGPPTIAGNTVPVTAGAGVVVGTIATVNDDLTPKGSLVVTAGTLPTGITLTGISNAGGTITATVSADCSATVGANTIPLTVTDGNGLTATANLTVNVTLTLYTYTGGIVDKFKLPADAVFRRAALTAAFPAATWRRFDEVTTNDFLGYSFPTLPTNIIKAELEVTMRPLGAAAANDTINLGLVAPNSFAYSRTIASLPGAGGTWANNAAVIFKLDLGNLPGGGGSLIPKITTDKFLDILIREDTAVDYIKLRIWTCPPQLLLLGAPVVVSGTVMPTVNPDGSLRVSSGGVPTSVQFDLGQATGSSVELSPGPGTDLRTGCCSTVSSVKGLVNGVEDQTVVTTSFAGDGTHVVYRSDYSFIGATQTLVQLFDASGNLLRSGVSPNNTPLVLGTGGAYNSLAKTYTNSKSNTARTGFTPAVTVTDSANVVTPNVALISVTALNPTAVVDFFSTATVEASLANAQDSIIVNHLASGLFDTFFETAFPLLPGQQQSTTLSTNPDGLTVGIPSGMVGGVNIVEEEPGVKVFDLSIAPVDWPADPIPGGAYLEASVYGSLGGTPDQLLGTLRSNRDWIIPTGRTGGARFGAFTPTTTFVRVYSNNVLVVEVPNFNVNNDVPVSSDWNSYSQSKSSTALTTTISLSASYDAGTIFTINGTDYVGDKLEFGAVVAGNAPSRPTSVIGDFTSSKLTAVGIPEFTITGAQKTLANNPPTIAAVAVTRQAGSPSASATIANVSDTEDAKTALTVKVNNATTATVNGVTVSGLSVDSAGVVTANVVAACGATKASFALTVFDSGGLTFSTGLDVTVNANDLPMLAYNATQTVAAGGATTINPTFGPTDNGSVTGIAVQSLGTFTGTLTVDNSTGVVSVSNAKPGGSHTITIRVTDNCGATKDTSFTLTVTCPTITVTPPTLPNGIVGSSYGTQTLSASGGSAPYTFTLDSGTLPDGVMLSGIALTGTPTATGVFNFTLKATDNNGCVGMQSYTVVISGTGLQFYPLAVPVRLVDTRTGQAACTTPGAPITGGTALTQVSRGTCGIPATAKAVTGNVTAVLPAANGFLTIYPSDAVSQPTAANTNFIAGDVLNNVFTVGLGAADGAMKIFASSTADVVVDITGYFAPPGAGGLYFHKLPRPIRLLETRTGQAAGCFMPGAPLAANSETTQQGTTTCDGVTIPATAKALVGNATTVFPAANGFLTLYPADAISRPLAASGNYRSGTVLNSPFTVGLSPSGQFKIYTVAQTDLVIDVLGYYSADAQDGNGVGLLFTPLTPARLVDTRSGQTACFTPNAPLTGGVESLQAARGVCTIANTAQAIVGNATTVQPTANGFLTFWPSDAATRPLAATSNFQTGRNFNRHYTVGLGTDGAFKMYAAATTNLVIDVSGYFAP